MKTRHDGVIYELPDQQEQHGISIVGQADRVAAILRNVDLILRDIQRVPAKDRPRLKSFIATIIQGA